MSDHMDQHESCDKQISKLEEEAARLRAELAESKRQLHYVMPDFIRFRWLTADHSDRSIRERVQSICESIPVRSVNGVRADIDANMLSDPMRSDDPSGAGPQEPKS